MSRLFRTLQWQRLRLLSLAWVAAGLCGCVMFREPITTPPQPVHPAPGSANPGSANPYPAIPATAVPAPAPAPPAVTAPPATRQFHLGPAATALVAQAHRQAGGGDPQLAISTLERALRIEPDNPLLWIELGEVHESAGHFEQAGGIGHKALQLATGDPHAQSSSWRLIAESLKARNRNGEAAEAQHRADELSAQ
jgi:tetratricopeptide (TPR) repeat protein